MNKGFVVAMMVVLGACGGSEAPPEPENPRALPSTEDVGQEWQPVEDRLGTPNMSALLAGESSYRYVYRAARCDDGWCVALEGEDWRPYSVDVQFGRITRASPHPPITVRFTNSSSLPVRLELGTEYSPGEYGPSPDMGYGVLRSRIEPGETYSTTFHLIPGYFLTTHLLAKTIPDAKVVVDHWDGFFVNNVDDGHSITFVHVDDNPTVSQPRAN